MTREIATYLAQVPNLYIMASIDGPRTVHDAYRVYANDAPTFEDSIGGLRILADQQYFKILLSIRLLRKKI